MKWAIAALALTAFGCLTVFGGGRASTQETPCSRLPQPGETAIIGRVASPRGSVHIPELDLTSPIVGGCFEFRDLQLPRSPMLVSFEINAEGFRPGTWANYLVMFEDVGAVNFSPTLHPGTEPERIDPCPSLLAHPQTMSAALQLHASLCAQLPNTGAGMIAGPASTAGFIALLLAATGTCLLLVGAGMRPLRPR